MALLLFKKSIEASFTTALSPDAGQSNVCTYLGWLAANVCVQAYAAAAARGNASVASWDLATAATCNGKLARLPILDYCNVTAAAILAATTAQAAIAATPTLPSPLIFGSVLSGRPPARAALTVKSSTLVGALRVTFELGPTTSVEGCAAWFKGGDVTDRWSSPLPPALQLTDTKPNPILSDGAWAASSCASFKPSTTSEMVSVAALRWHQSFSTDNDVTDASAVNIVDIPSDADLAPDALALIVSTALGRGAAALRAIRLDTGLYQPAIGKNGALCALRVTTAFPPFMLPLTTTTVKVMTLSDVPASLSGYSVQLTLLVLFVLINVRAYGSAQQLRWLVIDYAIPALTIIIVAARAWQVNRTQWLTPDWSPIRAPSGTYLDTWTLAGVAYLDDDLSAAILMLGIFRIVEYLESTPMNVGITLQSILNMWFSSRTLIYLFIMLGFMGAQAVVYQLTFGTSSETFVTIPQAFFSLLSSGFFQQQFDYDAVDARPMLTILAVLWPINFLIFASGYVAVLSDVWASVEAAAQKAWRQDVVTRLQDALQWAENPELKDMRHRISTYGFCCGCARRAAGLGSLHQPPPATPGALPGAPSAVPVAVPLPSQRSLAFSRTNAVADLRRVGAAAERLSHNTVTLFSLPVQYLLLIAERFMPHAPLRNHVHFFFDAGLPALLLAVAYVLRVVIDSMRWLCRCGRCKRQAVRGGGGGQYSPPHPRPSLLLLLLLHRQPPPLRGGKLMLSGSLHSVALMRE